MFTMLPGGQRAKAVTYRLLSHSAAPPGRTRHPAAWLNPLTAIDAVKVRHPGNRWDLITVRVPCSRRRTHIVLTARTFPEPRSVSVIPAAVARGSVGRSRAGALQRQRPPSRPSPGSGGPSEGC